MPVILSRSDSLDSEDSNSFFFLVSNLDCAKKASITLYEKCQVSHLTLSLPQKKPQPTYFVIFRLSRRGEFLTPNRFFASFYSRPNHSGIKRILAISRLVLLLKKLFWRCFKSSNIPNETFLKSLCETVD